MALFFPVLIRNSSISSMLMVLLLSPRLRASNCGYCFSIVLVKLLEQNIAYAFS